MSTPFAVVRRLLGRSTSPSAPTPPCPPHLVEHARHIGRGVRAAARRTPWASDCYPQALAARAQLVAARVPHSVHFGVRRDAGGDLVAHAWVLAGDRSVVGGRGEGYTPVGNFVWSPQHGSVRRREAA